MQYHNTLVCFSPVAIVVHLKVIAEMLAQPGGYPPPLLLPRTFAPENEQDKVT